MTPDAIRRHVLLPALITLLVLMVWAFRNVGGDPDLRLALLVLNAVWTTTWYIAGHHIGSIEGFWEGRETAPRYGETLDEAMERLKRQA